MGLTDRIGLVGQARALDGAVRLQIGTHTGAGATGGSLGQMKGMRRLGALAGTYL